MWNLSKGAWEENFQAPGSVRCVTLSPDGKLLAAGSQDPAGEQSITIWSMEERTIPHQTVPTNLGFLHSLSFSHDGQFLACGGEEGVAIFEATNYRRWSLIRGDIPYSVAFSPDQQLLAFSSMQLELVRLWNVATNREIVRAGYE